MTHSVLDYHNRTKHHFHRYARSVGYMDWANQPNPFRTWEGSPQVPLPVTTPDPDGDYGRLFAPAASPEPLTEQALSRFLALSLGLSAWKAAGGSRWSLRINPSSGNLHPTEGYLILPVVDERLTGGVYHYHPFGHALEARAVLPEAGWDRWRAHFRGRGFAVALTTIFWRESWKYGERALRYCLLDGGHALAALSLAARLLGWTLTCLTAVGDEQIDTLLGLDRVSWPAGEMESAELLGWVAVEAVSGTPPRRLPEELVQPFGRLVFAGRPNRLSHRTVRWPVIEKAAAAARKPRTDELPFTQAQQRPWVVPPPTMAAANVIRRRRSAVAFDSRREIGADTFLAILDRTLPRAGVPPFDAALMDPAVDLLIFVHRVAGVASGLYWLQRTAGAASDPVPARGAAGEWQPAHPDLPLHRLMTGDVRHTAMSLSCHQAIAGDSAFALAMLAPLKSMVAIRPFLYRHLHWECGMIGQMLYLEAEAQGVRGTGIGCFFDDPVQELLGITDDSLQSLYHFTVGHFLEDPRLATLPPYHHLPTGE